LSFDFSIDLLESLVSALIGFALVGDQVDWLVGDIPSSQRNLEWNVEIMSKLSHCM
jgi:hypothetical protein